MNDQRKRQVRFGTSIAGVNHWTLWGHPDAPSQIAPSTFLEQARTAERGLFDFFFLTEGLRLREYFGKIHDLDVVGRPDNLTMLAALAGATERIGLIATVSATFNEPYDLARRLASLDHLSDGRAGWNIVTSSDAFTGANFRRGGYLQHAERYTHADEFLRFAKQLWDATAADADRPSAYGFTGRHHRGTGEFALRRSPQRYPVFMQAGDSDQGRAFAVEAADLVFTVKPEHPEGTEFLADLRRRAVEAGRDPESLLVFAKAEVVLGDSDAEARDLQHEVGYQQISPATARNFLGLAWGREFPELDVDAPPPAPEAPAPDAQGRLDAAALHRHERAVAWHEEARERGWSVRDLIVQKHTRQTFVGTAASVAAQIDRAVQQRVADGFIVGTPAVPTGLRAFVDDVVPLLQERGVYPTEYAAGTFRERLGLGQGPRG